MDNGSRVNREVYARFCERLGVKSPGPTYLFVRLRGEPYVLWRAVDEHGAELDILLLKRRDTAAAERFFKRVLHSCPVPRKIVTDHLRSYPTATSRIPELANAKHVFVKAAARANNRAENSHQPTRERERRLRGFFSTAKSPLSVLTHGIVSPSSPRIRPPSEQRHGPCSFAPPTSQRDSA